MTVIVRDVKYGRYGAKSPGSGIILEITNDTKQIRELQNGF